MKLRYLTIAAVMLAAGAAIAQDKPAEKPYPVPVTAIQDPLTIVIPRASLQAIGQGLMKLPYETAAPILNDLQAQLNKADQAATEEARKVEEEKAKAAAKPANDNEKPKSAPAAAAK